jgi:predicted deacylase
MNILGQDIKYGKTVLNLDIAKLHTGTPLDVPIIVQRSQKPGPTLLLTAGIHGNEVNGVEIVRQLIHKKYNIPEKGTIICIPVVNVFGFINQERKFPDGRDLNRVFPGGRLGSLASRFAYAIMNEIIPHIDYCIDFHTGGDQRFNYAQIRIDASDKETLELAKVFGSKFVINSPILEKSFRKSVTLLGKKILLFEGGKSLNLDRIVTKRAIEGTLSVLHRLGFRTDKEELAAIPNVDQHYVTSSSWVRAPKSGMYRSFTKLGSFVEKNQFLGSVSDPFGGKEKSVKAPNAGYIICQNHAPIVNQGDALFHITTEAIELK